jgi:acyl-CoA dehydrogenase
MPLAI